MDTYFANEPIDKIGDCLMEKVQEWFAYINRSGYYKLWKTCYKYYYNGYHTRGEVQRYGKQGEKRMAMINHFHNLLKHIKVLTTNQRPAFEPRAVNSDYKSAAQVKLARELLDYFMRHENLEQNIDTCLDYALQAGEGFIFQEWDADVGKVIGQVEEEVESEDGEEKETSFRLKKEGNIKTFAFHPIDVVRDFYATGVEHNDWFIVRKRINKYELAAKYPRFEKEILMQELDPKLISESLLDDFDTRQLTESDLIHEYVFRHAKTAAVPEGRQTVVLNDGTVIFDSDLPYSDLSIYRLIPTKRLNTNIGYTVAFDLLPLQKIVDMLDSTIVTNQSTFGTQNITAPKAAGVNVNDLGDGLNLIEFNGDMAPKPLELLKTPAEIFNYRQQIVNDMETISGVNAVSRGNPEPNVKSGAYGALLQSMTIQYNSGLQQSYIQLLEKVGTGTINILKDYASAPRVALITGISNRSYLKEFTRDDINQIDRVIVDMGNFMSRTPSGKAAIADALLERGLIKQPEQYVQVLETGRLEPVTESQSAELMLIKSENEALINNQAPRALYSDNHQLHIREHATVLASTDARSEQAGGIVQATIAHQQEHINLLKTTNPELLILLGQQPLQGVTPPTSVPPQNIEMTPDQGQGGTAPQMSEDEGLPNMPNLPKNALTQETWNPQTGGL